MQPVLKVLVVTHYCGAHRGGVELVAEKLAGTLAAQGAHVTWMASDCDPAPTHLEGVTAVSAKAWNGLEPHGFPWPLWSPAGYRALWRQVRAADVVHLHDYLYAANVLAFVFATLLGKPVVITQHIGDTHYPNPIARGVLWLLHRTLGRVMLAGADQVAFISHRVLTQFSRYTRFRRPPKLVRNGVDLGVFTPLTPEQRAAKRRQLGLAPEQRVFLFVGRFTENKGLRLLRELAIAMPEALWWFAGWGGQEEAHRPGDWNLPNVRVWGGLSGPTLAEIYQVADLLVLPSFAEGFPLVVQEALACGTPALVSAETSDEECWPADVILSCLRQPTHDACARWQTALEAGVERAQDLDYRARVAAHAAAEWSWRGCAATYAATFAEVTGRPLEGVVAAAPREGVTHER